MMMRTFYLKLLVVCGLIAGLSWGAGRAQATSWLHAEGSQLVDSAGNAVILTGINWFGLETESYAPHGLWARNWESILDQVVALGFNTIRLPYSNQLFDPSSQPNSVNEELNPDLKGLTGLEIMDKIIAGAGQRGLKVIIDRHRPDSHAQSDLWYTSEYSEERWIADWVMLAQRYAGDDTVIGADLHNEPHGRATWGSDDPVTDWRLAAEKAGNAILKVNPNLLIIVQGVEQYQGDWYWWGGNLLGAREHPVRLDLPSQLVYSTHLYGPGVYPQPWFSDPSFPDNLPEIWDRHWGYLSREEISPVIVGEFGGRSVGEDKEGIWQRALVDYLRQHNFSYIYWTLNPNSGDTGGILLDDWQSVDPEKEALLSEYQFPLIGIEQRGPDPGTRMAPATPLPSATPPPPSTPVALAVGALQVKYRTANPSLLTRDSKPEFALINAGASALPLSRVELRYWLSTEDLSDYVFHCDWAAMGCASLTGEFLVSEEGYPYLSLRFGEDAGVLLAGGDSGEIKLRFNRVDWSEYPQDGHYSFSPSTETIQWERVGVYVDGGLVWGVEPGSEPVPTLTATLLPSETALPPTATTPASLPESSPTPPPLPAAQAPDTDWVTPALFGVIFASGMWILLLAVGRIASRRSGNK